MSKPKKKARAKEAIPLPEPPAAMERVVVTGEMKRKRAATLEHFILQGWPKERLEEVMRSAYGMGPKATARLHDEIMKRWHRDGVATVHGSLVHVREAKQVDELIRKLLFDDKGVELKVKDMNLRELTKLLALRADLTGARHQARDGGAAAPSYLGTGDEDVGGRDLAGPEE